MSPQKTELVSDPLFQLNFLLWLTQPLPEGSSITPLFFQRNFSVYAISPALVVPLDLQVAAQQAQIKVQPSAKPDVVLTHDVERKFAFSECKASSFGPDSTTADQARSFLVTTSSRAAEVLGLDAAQVRECLLDYLVPESQRALLLQTLGELTSQLSQHGLPTGNFSILGLQATNVEIVLILDEAAAVFFSLSAGSHSVIKFQPDTDPRPLYFIPYDPDVTYASDAEKLFCKRMLFERIHGSVVVAAGRSTVPAEIVLTPNGLLNDAMFGMYALWESRESARHMRGSMQADHARSSASGEQ